MRNKKNLELKPLFEERMKKLLEPADYGRYKKILGQQILRSIRCNTLKISPEDLKKKLEEKSWKISQLWKNYPEVMIVDGKIVEEGSEKKLIELGPGELGRAIEHILGYYYIQELASMLPIIILKPKPEEKFLDLCASPGSKTTQASSEMKNTGTIIANEINLGRIKILASNLERCGVTNSLITMCDGVLLCERFKEQKVFFDKILVDAPCSGEGTLRSSPKTYFMWNIKTIRGVSKLQKKLFEKAFEILTVDGEIVYSTCTHAPEENEEIVNFALEKFGDKIKIEKIILPIKCREGITEWEDKKFSKEVKNVCRIYPHDNNTEGFFISKFKRIKA